MKKHEKHTALVRPQGGRYHRTEFGFVGGPCPIIQDLSRQMNSLLKSEYLIGYMDAEHGKSTVSLEYTHEYIDKIGFHQMTFEDDHIDFNLKARFEKCDALLINANHFPSDSQIVLINEKKKESLSRKLNRLNNVLAFVLTDDVDQPFDYLKNALPNYRDIPIIKASDIHSLAYLISQRIKRNIPELHGLLLYGGQSTRMGIDKGKIQYHDKPQVEYLHDVLSSKCEEVLISVSSDENQEKGYISDTFKGLGPYGGILSAFRHNPNMAYLSLPCDVPFIDDELIDLLIQNRDPSKYATCFHNPDTQFPEPLITIWEPKSYHRLLYFLSMGYSCPRKVLINSEIKEINPPSPLSLYNANTPEESEYVKSQLAK